jgi:5-hydroxyisourate hydrolase-like protein (transthyretin family)
MDIDLSSQYTSLVKQKLYLETNREYSQGLRRVSEPRTNQDGAIVNFRLSSRHPNHGSWVFFFKKYGYFYVLSHTDAPSPFFFQ